VFHSSCRFWKPFNPLLGETFEFINHDVGYALIAEQASKTYQKQCHKLNLPHFTTFLLCHPSSNQMHVGANLCLSLSAVIWLSIDVLKISDSQMAC